MIYFLPEAAGLPDAERWRSKIGCVFIWIDHNGSIVFAAQVYCLEQLMTSSLDEPV
jgi:hypothetical protein